MILVDSDVLIEHLRGNTAARDWLVHARQSSGPLAISVVSLTEIAGGMRSPERREVLRLLGSMQRFEVSEQVAWRAATLMRENRRSHTGIGLGDYLIAATALRGSGARHTECPPLSHVSRSCPALPGLKAVSPPRATGRGRSRGHPLAVREGPPRDLSSPGVPAATTRPWSMRAIRSDSRSASSRYCVVSRTVVPCAASQRIACHTWLRLCGSSPVVGSSCRCCRPEQGEHAAARHRQVEPVHRPDGPERLDQPARLDRQRLPECHPHGIDAADTTAALSSCDGSVFCLVGADAGEGRNTTPGVAERLRRAHAPAGQTRRLGETHGSRLAKALRGRAVYLGRAHGRGVPDVAAAPSRGRAARRRSGADQGLAAWSRALQERLRSPASCTIP